MASDTALGAGSTRSLDELLEALTGVLSQESGDQAAGSDRAELVSRDLFAVVSVLDREPTLRRILTEPSVPLDVREAMTRSLFDQKVSTAAIDVLAAAVRLRWSSSRDLATALERCGVTAEASAAEQRGELDRLEDDLFRFGRILEANPDLRDALADQAISLEGRRALVDGLLRDKAAEQSRRLIAELLVGRYRSLAAGLVDYQEITAALRRRLVATVWSAAALTDEQRERIAAALSRDYDREVHLNVLVDPDVLGGVRIAIGDDVIDSTIESRLAAVQRRPVR